MPTTADDWAAIWGATTGTLSLAIQLWAWWRQRRL